MKFRGTVKKGISFAMTLALVLTLLLNVGVLEPKAAGFTLKFVNITLTTTGDSGEVYYKNGDTKDSSFTGTADDYNAKFAWDGNDITITFKNLNVDYYTGSFTLECGDEVNMTFVLEGTNVMKQNMGNVISSYNPIKVPRANLTIKGSGSLELLSDMSTNTLNGVIQADSVYITESALVSININKLNAYNDHHGILTTTGVKLDSNATLNINMGATQSLGHGIFGIVADLAVGKVEILGNSNLSIKQYDTVREQQGIACYDFDASTTGNISIEIGNSSGDNYGVHTTYGINAWCFDVVDTSISVSVGDVGPGWAYGIKTGLDMSLSGQANVQCEVLGGANIYGVQSNSALNMSDNTNLQVTVGDGTIEEYGVKVAGANINGGQVEVTSPSNSFSVVPTFATDKIFEVKAGADASSATAQTATQKEEATTYTDNSYVLIRGLQPVDEVEVTDIDDIKHGNAPDTAASSATTGVSSDIPLTWAPTGSAVGGTEYTATMVISPADGYAFTADTKVYVDGTAVTATLQDDGTLKATIKKTAEKLNLVSVEGPSSEIVADNGTDLANISLPSTATITTDDGATDDVEVRWDLSNVNYNPSSKEEQVVTVNGTAVIPSYVYAGNVSTNVLATVRVKAAPTTEATTQVTTEATTQAPSTGSMTDTEAPTTAATTEAPDNSDDNVKTGDNAPLNVMVMLMLVSGMGMFMVSKKRKANEL